MKLEANILIHAKSEDVWTIISDIGGAKDRISGIENLEMLHKPQSGLVGTKWKETRICHGKSSVETMWIIEADEGHSYMTQAESHGCIYRSGFQIEDVSEGSLLEFTFRGEPQTMIAKLMNSLLMPFFKGSIIRMMENDLKDIKVSVEDNQ